MTSSFRNYSCPLPVWATAVMLLLTGVLASHHAESQSPSKLRVIATTDGEVDDRCSMVRFLLYANEWDIQGIIHSSSKYHWKGDADHPEHDWEPVEWLDRQLDQYAAVYPNLILHDPGYPSPDDLRAKAFVGNIAYEGEMDTVTAGSTHIVDVLLDPDTSPIWLQAWGGSNTIARALKTIAEDHPDRVAEVSAKARIYLITEQDNTFKTYIRPEWPSIQVLRSGGPAFGAIAYDWRKMQSPEVQTYFDEPWMTAHILQDHGPLCAGYEVNKDGSFRSEGDSPSFLHTIPNGLRSTEHPSYGGWGGHFAFSNNTWKSVDTNESDPHSILRWAKDFQNDWAARADWCVKAYGEANHAPIVALTHPTDFGAKAGDVVQLDASPTTDPDGDTLSFTWWHYAEAGTYRGTATIDSTDGPKTSVTIPADAQPGDTLHFVCTATDNGTPPLTRYARVVITVIE